MKEKGLGEGENIAKYKDKTQAHRNNKNLFFMT